MRSQQGLMGAALRTGEQAPIPSILAISRWRSVAAADLLN